MSSSFILKAVVGTCPVSLFQVTHVQSIGVCLHASFCVSLFTYVSLFEVLRMVIPYIEIKESMKTLRSG